MRRLAFCFGGRRVARLAVFFAALARTFVLRADFFFLTAFYFVRIRLFVLRLGFAMLPPPGAESLYIYEGFCTQPRTDSSFPGFFSRDREYSGACRERIDSPDLVDRLPEWYK